MKRQTILKRRSGRKRRSAVFARLLSKCRARAIVIMWGLMSLLLLGCAGNEAVLRSVPRPRENCRKYVVTYGDAIECMIKLDERQE